MTWLAKPRLESLDGRHSLPLTAAFADGGYQGRLEGWAAEEQSLELKIVRRPRGSIPL